MIEPRTRSRLTVVFFVATAVVVLSAGGWLYAQKRGAAVGQFGPIGAEPAYIVVSTSTPVLFTAQITDPQLKKRSVVLVRLGADGGITDIVGRLQDDGINGDLRANDSTYSFRETLNEAAVGTATFKVAARFKLGRWPDIEWDDDDWDRELSIASRDAGDRDEPATRQARSSLLKKLDRYKLSNPVIVTVDPFPLPPDPGESGEQTLEGIDSDGDGVRDDVQRWIGTTYHESRPIHDAITQYAVALQDLLEGGTDRVSSVENATATTAALRCLFFHLGITEAQVVTSELISRQLDTDARSRLYASIQSHLGGQISRGVSSGQYQSYCRP